MLCAEKKLRHKIVRAAMHAIGEKIYDDPEVTENEKKLVHSMEAVSHWAQELRYCMSDKVRKKDCWALTFVVGTKKWVLCSASLLVVNSTNPDIRTWSRNDSRGRDTPRSRRTSCRKALPRSNSSGWKEKLQTLQR